MNTLEIKQDIKTENVPVLEACRILMECESFDTVLTNMKTRGIKVSYNPKVIILSVNNMNKCKFSNLERECNGLVLERDTYKPLVVPPRSLRTYVNNKILFKNYQNKLYKIYKAEDGTLINMYFYDNKWIISTTKGHTMNDVKWNDKISYQEMVTECLSSTGLNWKSFTEQLNINNCYTFGFKHPLMHRFQENHVNPIYKIWFVQSVSLNAENMTVNDVSPIAIIPNQSEITNHPTLDVLINSCNSAMNNYETKKEITYGYILRSNDTSKTGDHSDILLTSRLLQFLQKTLYDHNLITYASEKKYDLDIVISFSGYLYVNSFHYFIMIYPQYANEYTTYTKYISSLVENIMEYYSSKNLPSNGKVTSLLIHGMSETLPKNMLEKHMSNTALRSAIYNYVRHPEALSICLDNDYDYLCEMLKQSKMVSAESTAQKKIDNININN